MNICPHHLQHYMSKYRANSAQTDGYVEYVWACILQLWTLQDQTGYLPHHRLQWAAGSTGRSRHLPLPWQQPASHPGQAAHRNAHLQSGADSWWALENVRARSRWTHTQKHSYTTTMLTWLLWSTTWLMKYLNTKHLVHIFSSLFMCV